MLLFSEPHVELIQLLDMVGIKCRGSNPGPLLLQKFSTFRTKSMLALHLSVLRHQQGALVIHTSLNNE